MDTFKLTISTPDGNMLDEDVTALFVRGADGDLAILARHMPFITTVVPGECRVEFVDTTEKKGHTDGGILSVGTDGVTLLSGTFKWL